jgi:hypothetical protein
VIGIPEATLVRQPRQSVSIDTITVWQPPSGVQVCFALTVL